MNWAFETNSDDILVQFLTYLEKDTASKGNFNDDYNSICAQYKVTPCPYIKSFRSGDTENEQLKVSNGLIDLSSWRAMLLACSVVGSKVTEINVHSCQLTSKHISELAKTLEKMTTVVNVKLQYLYVLITPETTPLWIDAFRSLFSDTCCVEYISLKGCRMGNEIITGAVSALNNNYKLRSLNLSDNLLTDDTITELLKAIKLKTNINEICVSNNQLFGAFLPLLTQFFTGMEVSPDDEATVKANVKLLGEKNKIIKDTNKKRKKANLPDIPECNASSECITKGEGKGAKSSFSNRNFSMLDFSGNAGMEVETFVTPFYAALQQFTTVTTGASSDSKMTLSFRGLTGLDVSGFASDWAEIVL